MVNLVGIFSRHIIVRTFVITLLVFLGITFLDLIFSIIGDTEDLNEEFTLNDLIFITLGVISWRQTLVQSFVRDGLSACISKHLLPKGFYMWAGCQLQNLTCDAC